MAKILKRTDNIKKNKIDELNDKLNVHEEKIEELTIDQQQLNETLTYFLMISGLLLDEDGD